MILRGARVALGPDEAAELDLEIVNGRIQAMRKASKKPPKGAESLDLAGHLILPGLINTHDHLEFNLYPRLGNGPYSGAGAWARDIYRPAEPPIREQLAIPRSTRLLWGGLKNLICGVTTVCHHNDRDQAVLDRNFPVRVLKRFGWAHSLEFSADVAGQFLATPPDWPFILHLGEGIGKEARREIFRLDEIGALDHRTVLVHGVALDGKGMRLAKQRGAALIWCPSSNLFLLGRTLNGALSAGIPVALGSDSALTAQGDLLDEIRVARKYLPAARVYRMVTGEAARILRLPGGAGGIAPGCPADLIAIADGGRSPSAALMRMKNPALVLLRGKIKLIAAKFRPPSHFQRLNVEGRGEFFVDANLGKLRQRVVKILGEDFRLAGRRVYP